MLGEVSSDSNWRTFWPLEDPDLVLARDWSSTVRVWRLSTGKEVRRFAHTHTANGVAVARDAKRAVTPRKGAIRVWDVDTLRPVLTVEALPDAKVREVSFSAGGERLFVLENAREFGYRIWDIATGREIARLDGSHLREVPDSTDILLRHGSEWRLWDRFSGDFETRPWPKSASRMRVSADGAAITTHDKESFFNIDVETGAMRSLRPIPPDEELAAYRLSNLRDLLAFSQRKLDPYRPGAVSLRRLPRGEKLKTTSPNAVIAILAFADGDDSLILAGTPGGWILDSGTSLVLWRWRTGEIKTLSENQSIHDIAVSPRADIFVTGEGQDEREGNRYNTMGKRRMRVWDARRGGLLKTLPLDERVYDLAFSPDGTFLAARQAGKVRILDPSSDWTETQVLKMYYGTIVARVHLGTGNRVIVSDAKGYYRDGVAGIRVWNPDGDLEHLLRTNREFVPLAFSRDGRAIAARDGDLLRVWDLETGTELTRHRFGDGFSFAFAGKDDQLFVRAERARMSSKRSPGVWTMLSRMPAAVSSASWTKTNSSVT